MRVKGITCAVLAALFVLGLASVGMAQDSRKPIVLEGKKILPLRVLCRPFSNVYKTSDEAGGTVRENVAAFTSYYVYTRPTPEDLEMEKGWYEVGSDNRGSVLGWMKASDVFEWKQTMCLAYTHPQDRNPVLMFDRRTELDKMVGEPTAQRTATAQGFYQAIESGSLPKDFPVVSVEPKKYVDMSKQFYLLPILDFGTVELDGREGRVVRLAAVTKSGPGAREQSDIRENKNYLQEATTGATQVSASDLKDLKIDIVWVMDTTVSMRPYIQQTMQVVRDVSEQITLDTNVSKAMKFGIWGYRDPVDQIQGIGYTTNNYTPQLQGIADFMQTLAGVDVTPVDSVDYAEDVFSGMADAIQQTQWTPGAIRFIILVGDAPGHELGHKYNASGQDDLTIRSFANDQSAYIFSVHVKNPKAKQEYHDTAEKQFQELARNKGTSGQAAYWSVFSDDLDGFTRVSMDVASRITGLMQSAMQGAIPAAAQTGEMAGLDPAPAPASTASAAPQSTQMVDEVVRAALVEWVGSKTGAQAPRDIVAWAVDKDLVNPALQSMEVRLLVSKSQLDSLKTVLDEIMAAGLRGQISAEKFFDALQATSAAAARDPEKIKNATRLADTGLVPEFLEGLPYKSQLMDMNNELWEAMGVDGQETFLEQLDARVKTYKEIHDSPDLWVELNKGDDPNEYVYPISLELLP
ncbi:MAG: vWA domain-containing protein [Desulfovibrionaceae bacterium]